MRSDPAFPQSDPVDDKYHPSYGKDRGMTLRDYFAAQAMLGYMNDCYELDHKERATAAYEQADAMLMERQK